MRFLCPHCGQTYFGTDRNGLVSPQTFRCTQCENTIDINEMILEPTHASRSGDCAELSPWLSLGVPLASRWLQSVKLALFTPDRLIAATPRADHIWPAVLFAFVSQATFLACGWFLPVVFLLVSTLPVAGASGLIGMVVELLQSVTLLFGASLLLVIVMVPLAVVVHVILRVTGPVRSDLGRTFQCVCYSSGATALLAVPVFSPLMAIAPAPVWWGVSLAAMLRFSQTDSKRRVLIAVWGTWALAASAAFMAILWNS